MRKFILLAISVILTTGLSLSALAQDTSAAPNSDDNAPAPAAVQPAATPSAAMTSKHHHNEACGRIFSACKSAGFGKNGANGKQRIWKDCIKPTLLGQSVPGVTADPNDIHTCKAKLAERMRKQAAELSESTGTNNAAPANSTQSQ